MRACSPDTSRTCRKPRSVQLAGLSGDLWNRRACGGRWCCRPRIRSRCRSTRTRWTGTGARRAERSRPNRASDTRWAAWARSSTRAAAASDSRAARSIRVRIGRGPGPDRRRRPMRWPLPGAARRYRLPPLRRRPSPPGPRSGRDSSSDGGGRHDRKPVNGEDAAATRPAAGKPASRPAGRPRRPAGTPGPSARDLRRCRWRC